MPSGAQKQAVSGSQQAAQPDTDLPGNVADSQQDADWLPSASQQQVQAAKPGKRAQRKRKLCSGTDLDPCEPRSSDGAQARQHAASDGGSQGSQRHQASAAVHVMHGRSHHKQQVIEDDDIEIVRETAAGKSQPPRLAAGAEVAPAGDVNDSHTASRNATGAIDRIAALSDVLRDVPNAHSKTDTDKNAEGRSKAKASISLLDAIMDDDDFGFGAPSSKSDPQQALPSLASAKPIALAKSAEKPGTLQSSADVQSDLPLDQEQSLSNQGGSDVQRHDVPASQPADESAEQKASAPRKGSLKDKMRALGMKV